MAKSESGVIIFSRNEAKFLDWLVKNNIIQYCSDGRSGTDGYVLNDNEALQALKRLAETEVK